MAEGHWIIHGNAHGFDLLVIHHHSIIERKRSIDNA
jgi:hypothetical protein